MQFSAPEVPNPPLIFRPRRRNMTFERTSMNRLWQFVQNLRSLGQMPRVTVNLQFSQTVNNDPFYAKVVTDFFQATQQRHRKFPLVRAWEYGVALCQLPPTPAHYNTYIESSANRNRKKALRTGYEFKRINFNDHLDDIRAIRQSTDVRQGRLPDDLLSGPVTPCQNPPSRNACHDYPYFGVLKDGHLYAYAGCLVAGELCMVEHVYGHATHQENGIVPLLYIGIASYLYEYYPQVRYYGYGTFYGAGETMRRFKKKFHFLPHHVNWVLGT